MFTLHKYFKTKQATLLAKITYSAIVGICAFQHNESGLGEFNSHMHHDVDINLHQLQ